MELPVRCADRIHELPRRKSRSSEAYAEEGAASLIGTNRLEGPAKPRLPMNRPHIVSSQLPALNSFFSKRASSARSLGVISVIKFLRDIRAAATYLPVVASPSRQQRDDKPPKNVLAPASRPRPAAWDGNGNGHATDGNANAGNGWDG